MYVYLPNFVLKVDTPTDFHLWYQPVSHQATLPDPDYIQPKLSCVLNDHQLAMNSHSAPVTIEPDNTLSGDIKYPPMPHTILSSRCTVQLIPLLSCMPLIPIIRIITPPALANSCRKSRSNVSIVSNNPTSFPPCY